MKLQTPKERVLNVVSHDRLELASRGGGYLPMSDLPPSLPSTQQPTPAEEWEPTITAEAQGLEEVDPIIEFLGLLPGGEYVGDIVDALEEIGEYVSNSIRSEKLIKEWVDRHGVNMDSTRGARNRERMGVDRMEQRERDQERSGKVTMVA